MAWAKKDVRKKDDLAPLRMRMQRDRIANIFGWRITKRTQGKAQVVLDQMDHGHHVLRLPLSRQGFGIQRSVFRVKTHRAPDSPHRPWSFLNPEH